MTSLTFYGRAGEIGGNKFLLEDKGVKISIMGIKSQPD